MGIQAVAFDIDGTLYPNREMYFRSVLFYLKHIKKVQIMNQIRNELRNTEWVGDFHNKQSELFSAYMGIIPEEGKEIISQIFYTEWENIFRKVKPFPAVKNVLFELKKRGLKLGVMSDFPVGNKLSYFHLDDVPWDVVLSSEESGKLKPHPDSFLYLSESLGVAPEHILYVGNNYKYDIIGGKSAGFKCAHIARKPFPETAADFTFSSYEDFLNLAEVYF